MSTAIQEDLAGIAVIKHYALEESRQQAFRAVTTSTWRGRWRWCASRGALMPLFAMLGGIGTLIVLWAGGREVIAGRMTVGSLVAFNGYLVLLSWPTFALGWIIGIWQRGIAGWVARARAARHAAADRRPGDRCAAGPPRRAPARRRSRCATWRSRSTGGGCSTACRSRCRRARRWRSSGATGVGQDDAGRRRCCACRTSRRARCAIGGRDVTAHAARARCGGLIGYAPQDAFLFSATVAENIGFGIRDEPDAARARARPARGRGGRARARHRGAAGRLRRRWSASAASRCRAGSASGSRWRARWPPIRSILILDDSLSSVDAQTEREILTRLRPILAGRTSILISHRVAAVKDADQILVLDARPRRRVAARTRRCSRRAASTRRSTASSSRQEAVRRAMAPEDLARARRSTGRCCAGSSLRLAVPGPAAGSRSRCCRVVAVLEIAQPYLLKKAIDEHIAVGRLAGLDRLGFLYLLALVGQYTRGVRAALLHAGDRPAGHERPARARAPPRACRCRRRSSIARRSAG